MRFTSLHKRFSLTTAASTASVATTTAPEPRRNGPSGNSALHRLGQAALKRARVASTASTTSVHEDETSADALPDLLTCKAGIRMARIDALCGHLDAPSSTQGSEDCFVPNSEDDAHDEQDDTKAEDEVTAAIDIGKFAYGV